MLIKELPAIVENKTFVNVKEFLLFIYEEQIVTEYGELTEDEITNEMKQKLEIAKKIPRTDFINL